MSTEFQIEKNIPIPPLRHKNSLELIDVLRSMEVGDSFAYTDDSKSKSGVTRFRTAAIAAEIKIAVRTLADNQFRVWRIQ